MADMVVCSRCSARAPRSETEFSERGDLLCARCAKFNQAHARVERTKQAVHQRTAVAYGAIDYALKVSERAVANTDAAVDHAFFRAVEVAGPVAAATAAQCSRCGGTFPLERMTYALDGGQMCAGCIATYDERAERRKIAGSSTTGFLLGFFLWVVGALIVVKRDKPAERAGLVFGLVAGTILLYFPLLTWLLWLSFGRR